MTTYKDCIVDAMTWLGQQNDTWVVGYNCKYSHFGGTLKGFPNERIIEMPLAEALMMGVSTGMALHGMVPITAFERMDFTTLAMDQIINHTDKLAALSDGIHKPGVIIRCCVGNKQKPLFTGPTHTQCFARAFRELVKFPVIQLKWQTSICKEYEKAYRRAKNGESTMLIEYKDLY